MKKSFTCIAVMILTLVLLMSFSLAGCKEEAAVVEEVSAAEEAVEEAVEEVEEPVLGEVIKIGNLQDLSGPTSVWGNAVTRGVELAIEAINNEGGIYGAKIELISYDIKLDPQEAINAYNRLVDRDKVVAVVGPPLSGVGLALASVAEEKKVPIVGSFMDPRVTVKEDGSPQSFMFLMQPTTTQYSEILADYSLEELGLKKVGIFYDQSNAYTVSLIEPFKAYFENNGGEIVAEEVFKAGDKDYRTQLSKIKESNVDALVAPNYIQDNVLTLQQMEQIGFDTTIIGAFDFAPPFVDTLPSPDMADNIYFLNNYSDLEPQLAEVSAKYIEKYNEEPFNKVYLGYDKILIIADAIKNAASLDPVKIKEALEKVKDLECTTGVITISPETHSPVGLSMVVYKIEKGEYKEIGRYVPEAHKQ